MWVLFNIISHSYYLIITGYKYGMLYQYIPIILVHILNLNKLRWPYAVNFITLPRELTKSLVNEKNWWHNVNILNSFHIFINNSFKYVLLLYVVSSRLMNINIIYLHLDVVTGQILILTFH